MRIATLILAAGLSSRMGTFKPLIQLAGKSLLGCCQTLFQECGLQEIVAVVGHRADETEAEAASLAIRCVRNTDYPTGMFSSIQCGVRSLPKKTEAFFVLPVDIPLIRPATLRKILTAAAINKKAIIYPVFAGRRGHPPLIPASLIPAILAHDGRGGLETLLDRHKGIDIAVWDEGIHLDADTPADLERLKRRLARISIPNRQEIDALAGQLLTKKGLAHSRMVCRAATALAQVLNDQGCSLDLDLIYGGALLHDVAKGQHRHEIGGAEMLAALGLKEIASIAAAHMDLEISPTGELTEKEVVCLADKFISGTRRTGIETRYVEKFKIFAGDQKICRQILGKKERALALKDRAEHMSGKRMESILNEAGL
ncbi:MAG: HD domain-containing protein [Desulfobulbaceae bacterium]|nr:MAG: HD domain-containing protein [Desulfobulbaceae bacterium]